MRICAAWAVFLASVVGQFQIIIFGGLEDDDDKYATSSVTPVALEKLIVDKDIPAVVIFYYTTWCRICHRVTPEYDKAAKFFEDHSPPIPFVRMNLWSHSEYAMKRQIQQLPTLHVVDNFGNQHAFETPSALFKSTDLVNWIKTILFDDHKLKSINDVDRHLHDNDRVVFGLFDENESNEAFKRATSKFDGIIFSSTTDSKVSHQVAEFLEQHHEHKCETIDIGQATEEVQVTKPLPYDNMDCSNHPINLQNPQWSDEFSVEVTDKRVIVRRTDQAAGWLQMLQIRCCILLTADQHKNEPITINIPSVVMFTSFKSDKFNVYPGPFPVVEQDLELFIKTHQIPFVSFMDHDKLAMLPSLKMPIIVLFAHRTSYKKDAVDRAVAAFSQAARFFPRAEIAAYIIQDEFEQVDQFAAMAVVDEDTPCIRILRLKSESWEKYRFSSDVENQKDIISFQQQFKDGQLRPAIRSEPLPDNDQPDDVPMILVGDTFGEVVHDPKKDVFVNIYAPWCGHCKRCMPEWERLATAVADRSDVIIAKLDGTENEVTDLVVTGFPTIVLYPKASVAGIEYEGERTLSSWIRFMNQHIPEKVTALPGDTIEKMRQSRLAKKKAERATELKKKGTPIPVSGSVPMKKVGKDSASIEL